MAELLAALIEQACLSPLSLEGGLTSSGPFANGYLTELECQWMSIMILVAIRVSVYRSRL